MDSYLGGYNPENQLLRVMIYNWAQTPDALKYTNSFSTFYLKFMEEIGKVLKRFDAERLLNDRCYISLCMELLHEVYHLLPKNVPNKTA